MPAFGGWGVPVLAINQGFHLSCLSTRELSRSPGPGRPGLAQRLEGAVVAEVGAVVAGLGGAQDRFVAGAEVGA